MQLTHWDNKVKKIIKYIQKVEYSIIQIQHAARSEHRDILGSTEHLSVDVQYAEI